MRYFETLPHNEIFEPVHGYEFADEKYKVFIPAEELFAYNQGELIQTAMPSVSAEDREWLMTGTSPEDWDQLFVNMF